MFNAPLVFDHLTLNARDELEPCCAALEAMGFVLTPPSYSNIGAVNRCIVLQGAYLEAIAINPLAQTPRRELMQQPLGLNAIVFRTEDADACFADLVARGFPALPVQPFTRIAKNSLGEDREVSFRVVRFESAWGADAFPFGRVYFCEHLNSETVFDPGYIRHQNGCRAFSEITVEVTDLARLSLTMRKLFGSAWSGDDARARLQTQALDILFLRASQDRVGTCTFRKAADVSVASNLRDSATIGAVSSSSSSSRLNIFENPYGRFSF
jgi:Glyoxalase-like domain